MSFIFQLIGYLGTLLSVLAYAPQIGHLLREHCSSGISIQANVVWLASSGCILLYSISISATVIIILQIANILAISSIIVLAKKYQGNFCPSHKPAKSKMLLAS